jgi:hypothetical protein
LFGEVEMSECELKEVNALSDTELLDSIEKLLCKPDFLDLALGFDHETREFYAGCEAGRTLREVLRTVLLENRPAGVPLREVIPIRRADRVA